jgi:lipopolysaccharide/colanic/teichoic acid biosynthesis glycosyltransferase
MIFAAIAHAFRRLTRRCRKSPRTGLRPAGEIARVLAVERARADRTGEPLSVVVFTPRTAEAEAATWALLGQALPGRLRVTDEAGWLDADRVCAVLPFTPAAGAWKVADDVALQFPDDLPPPICTVYSYPSGNIPSAGDGDRRPQPAGATPGGRAGADATCPVREPVPLEPLFLRPVSVGKRAVDVVGAAVGLLALLPLLPVVAAAIKLSSPGPVFFKQRRAGRGGRPFWMWKFRTMVADAEARKAELMGLNEQDGPAFKIKRDPRVTTVGRFLRSTSIDELPQLWNVLMGDMSLVGPRPLPCTEADGCDRWQRRRLDVTPGLTCIWQVKGRSAVSFSDWVRMDVEYIENQSLGEDLRLILLTVPALVRRKGAH